ncbi:MAG: Uncharacterised protein [Polaribacter sejongensis]|nr:MAG: Uncharacterised protein [Polaribacter sejongensis]
MKRKIKKSAFVVALVFVFTVVISCEKGFTDIGSSIISNTKFSTGSLEVDVAIENSPVPMLNFGTTPLNSGLLLLGVHASDDYEKIEASIISQLAINTSLKVIDSDTLAKYETLTTEVFTTIDTVFLRLPYQVTLNTAGDAYELDSIIGDQSKPFTLNVYQSGTYLSDLNLSDTSKKRVYSPNDSYIAIDRTSGGELNKDENFRFLPKATDTEIEVIRRLNDNTAYKTETVTYTNSATSTVPIPFAVIPLKEDKIKELFLDQYGAINFESQEKFNDYFRGIFIEATGDEGSLISFNFNGVESPSIEVYYTNTVREKATNDTIKTFRKNDRFLLSGIRTSTYQKNVPKTYPADEIVLQGAAGSEATLELFGTDAITVKAEIEALRARNLLINDASLTVYVDEKADITAVPYQLFLYKTYGTTSNSVYSQIKDIYTEGTFSFGGLLERDAEGAPEKYTFRITDYISDILSGAIATPPTLRLKVINSTDLLPVTDTIYTNFNWNPKAVTLSKTPKLKISYSEKKN